MSKHPITPPPELVREWRNAAPPLGMNREKWIATQAARWGADQELEACIEWLWKHQYDIASVRIRAVRRPKKPPSLKEQALTQLDSLHADLKAHGFGTNTDTIRRALEQLDD